MWVVTSRQGSHGLPALSCVWQHLKLSDVSLWAHLRYSLVVDEDVKKPNKNSHCEIVNVLNLLKMSSKVGTLISLNQQIQQQHCAKKKGLESTWFKMQKFPLIHAFWSKVKKKLFSVKATAVSYTRCMHAVCQAKWESLESCYFDMPQLGKLITAKLSYSQWITLKTSVYQTSEDYK